MRSMFFACGLLLIGANTSLAQDACHYSDKAYSSGAAIRLGEILVTCAPQDSGAYAWFVVQESDRNISANCLYAGQEYSHGSILMVRESGLVCVNGRWFKEKE